MKFFILCLAIAALGCGCYQAHSGDDLRGVPVTNNPNIIPNSHMAQRPGFPY
jgi:hypothetical protein